MACATMPSPQKTQKQQSSPELLHPIFNPPAVKSAKMPSPLAPNGPKLPKTAFLKLERVRGLKVPWAPSTLKAMEKTRGFYWPSQKPGFWRVFYRFCRVFGPKTRFLKGFWPKNQVFEGFSIGFCRVSIGFAKFLLEKRFLSLEKSQCGWFFLAFLL